METLTGTIVPSARYGWYFRPSTQSYEFWWGFNALILLDALMLEVMPTEAVMEIKASATIKRELTD